MISTVTHDMKNINNGKYLNALNKWKACKPPYTSSHMRICVTAAKTILVYTDKPRRSKYEKENYLRIEFNKSGKVTYYAEFPKHMALKGRKLGNYPEMTLDVAREKALLIAEDRLKFDSVISVIAAYEKSLSDKVERKKLSKNSLETYLCHTKNIKFSFGEKEIFCDITYNRLVSIVDEWIATKLRRIWKYGSPLYANSKNVAAGIQEDYVSSRVQKPTPTRLFTDIESIAQLWINSAKCPSIHQKNALRCMILTGVRPINIHNLMWDYVSKDLCTITYLAGITGSRGAMKTQKEFVIPITKGLKKY